MFVLACSCSFGVLDHGFAPTGSRTSRLASEDRCEQTSQSLKFSNLLDLSMMAPARWSKRSDARRAKSDERRRTRVVRRSGVGRAERSSWTFSPACSVLRIVAVHSPHFAKMAGISPCLQEPVALSVTEHVQSRVGEFKPARRIERN